jgi:hypothetical protein
MDIREVEAPEPRPGEVMMRAEYTLISPGADCAWMMALPGTLKKLHNVCRVLERV